MTGNLLAVNHTLQPVLFRYYSGQQIEGDASIGKAAQRLPPIAPTMCIAQNIFSPLCQKPMSENSMKKQHVHFIEQSS
jgi:hypothetical protein